MPVTTPTQTTIPIHTARGRTALANPLSPRDRAGAALLTLAFYATFAALGLWIFDAPPFLLPRIWILGGVAFAIAHILIHRITGTTLGRWAWRTQHVHHRAMPALLALVALGTTTASFLAWTWRHPLLLEATPEIVPAFTPPDAQAWTTAPFFFALGAWPRQFQGEPILFSFPYEKGPPVQFAGKMVARWKIPTVQLTLEGPKTPSEAASVALDALRTCLEHRVLQGDCADLRRSVLYRHWKEISRAVDPMRTRWSLKWFRSERPQGAQGFMLEGCGRTRCRSHWTLINARRSHQTIVLERRLDDDGAHAGAILKNILGSLRVHHELFPGKALANYRLSEIQLAKITQEADPVQMAAQIADVQALLLSKISVEPAQIDAYYHLAGTALMMLKKAASLRDFSRPAAQRPSARIMELADSWSAASKLLIQSAFRYTQDIDRNHPLSKRLENMWLDVSAHY